MTRTLLSMFSMVALAFAMLGCNTTSSSGASSCCAVKKTDKMSCCAMKDGKMAGKMGKMACCSVTDGKMICAMGDSKDACCTMKDGQMSCDSCSCCDDCAAPEKAGEAEAAPVVVAPAVEAPAVAAKAQATCPITGDEIDKDIFIDYKGQRVYFCCDGCDKKFLKTPDVYLKKFADAGVVLEKSPVAAPAEGAAKADAGKTEHKD